MLLPLQLVCALCVQPGLPALAGSWPGAVVAPPSSVEPSQQTTLASPAPFSGSLSMTIALSRARKLTLSATPSPTRCAPLLELAF